MANHLFFKDVVHRVKRQSRNPYRPDIRAMDMDTDRRVLDLMAECWEEDPKYRPDFHFVKKRLTQLNRGKWVVLLSIIKKQSYALDKNVCETGFVMLFRSKAPNIVHRVI